MKTRRDLFVKGMGVAAVAVATPSLLLAARPENTVGLRDHIDVDRIDGRFSNAVAEGVFSSFSALIVNHEDRANVAVAAHAWRVARDHFIETGFMAKGDQLIREGDVNQALSQLASTQQEVVAIAAKNGAELDLAHLQQRVALLTPDRIAEATAYLKLNGTTAVFDRVLDMLESLPNTSTRQASRYRAMDANGGGICQALALMEATLWVLSGLYAFGCAATLALCVACCIASAMLAIGAGVIDMIEVVYC